MRSRSSGSSHWNSEIIGIFFELHATGYKLPRLRNLGRYGRLLRKKSAINQHLIVIQLTFVVAHTKLSNLLQTFSGQTATRCG